jgi:hypothetical protein
MGIITAEGAQSVNDQTESTDAANVTAVSE